MKVLTKKTAVDVLFYGSAIAVGVALGLILGLMVVSRLVRAEPTNTVSIQAFCSGGLEPMPGFCNKPLKTAENASDGTLKVVNNYGEQITVEASAIQGGRHE